MNEKESKIISENQVSDDKSLTNIDSNCVKKRKSSMPYNIAIIILSAVMLFSLYKVISISAEYREGEAEYEEIAGSFVEEYQTVAIPKKNKPAVTDAQTDALFGDDADVTVDADTSADDVTSSDSQTEEPVTEAPEQDGMLVIPTVNIPYLESVNSDFVGWLYVDGLVINYPVVQTDNNDYYLDRTFYGQSNSSGCLFLDYRNDPKCKDLNTIIYGHAMKTGAMFGFLGHYAWPGFFEENKYIVYVTEDGPYLITVFSAYNVSATSDAWRVEFDGEADYAEWLSKIKAASEVYSPITPTTEDKIATLSTCSFKFDNARFVVHGIMEPLF